MQSIYWCEHVVDDMISHLSDMDDEKEFTNMTKSAADTLQAFVMGSAFHPFLEALDPNHTRVEERKKHVHAVATFKALTRDRGCRELNRWLAVEDASTAPYDSDDYVSVPNARVPLRYTHWMELSAASEAKTAAGPEDLQGIIAKALVHLLSYAHNLHYKLDYLLANMKLAGQAGSTYADDDLKARFPFLHNCDDHVAKLPHSVPIMLARTSAVHTFPHVVLCSFFPVTFFLLNIPAPTCASQVIS